MSLTQFEYHHKAVGADKIYVHMEKQTIRFGYQAIEEEMQMLGVVETF